MNVLFMHLTNYAVNKKNTNFQVNAQRHTYIVVLIMNDRFSSFSECNII